MNSTSGTKGKRGSVLRWGLAAALLGALLCWLWPYIDLSVAPTAEKYLEFAERFEGKDSQKTAKYTFLAFDALNGSLEAGEKEHLPDLARLNVYASDIFYYNNELYSDQLERYYQNAISLYSAEVPGEFDSDLAMLHKCAGLFYYGDAPEKAEFHFDQSIRLLERLSQTDMEKFGPDLAHVYGVVGRYYGYSGDRERSELYDTKGVDLYKQLTQIDRARFEPKLAWAYLMFFEDSDNTEYLDEALDIAARHKGNSLCREIIEDYG